MSSQVGQKWDSDAFWSAQDFQTSARLHLQHWIWSYQLGYTLHPKVDTTVSKPLRVADVGAGNGAWLLELGRKFPTDQIQLDGFDINPSNFPAPGWLPSNLHLHVWNAFSEIPEDYVGVFDIVHIRAIYSAVIDNLVEPLLSNLLKMLKPRGFLQWDKNDGDSLACHVPSPDVKADAAKTIVKIQQVISRGQSKLLPDWLHNLPTTLQDRGCELVAHEEIQPLTELARAWTDNILLVWRSILPMLPETSVTLPSGMGLRESISQASFAELFKKAVDESSNGAALNMEAVVVVARKAL